MSCSGSSSLGSDWSDHWDAALSLPARWPPSDSSGSSESDAEGLIKCGGIRWEPLAPLAPAAAAVQQLQQPAEPTLKEQLHQLQHLPTRAVSASNAQGPRASVMDILRRTESRVLSPANTVENLMYTNGLLHDLRNIAFNLCQEKDDDSLRAASRDLRELITSCNDGCAFFDADRALGLFKRKYPRYAKSSVPRANLPYVGHNLHLEFWSDLDKQP